MEFLEGQYSHTNLVQSGGSEEDGVGDNSEIHMLFHVDTSEFYGEIDSPFSGQDSGFWKKNWAWRVW